MNAHPASTIFPLMTAEDLVGLADDIRAHGLLEPIVTCDGLILDGRNRDRACGLVGVAPVYAEWDSEGLSPSEWVISKNLHRRHLTVAQRAVIALDLLPHLEAEAKERQGTRTDLATSVHERTEVQRSDEKAAALVGVGRSTVAAAKAIQARDPEIIERVKAGELNIAQASREAGFDALGQGGRVLEDSKRGDDGRMRPTVHFGKGDKFYEATEPLARYLRAWDAKGFEFQHVPPREARKRLAVLAELARGIEQSTIDLNRRSGTARLKV